MVYQSLADYRPSTRPASDRSIRLFSTTTLCPSVGQPTIQLPTRCIQLITNLDAYLDINCAHCHNPDGQANTSGLYLSSTERDPLRLVIRAVESSAYDGQVARRWRAAIFGLENRDSRRPSGLRLPA